MRIRHPLRTTSPVPSWLAGVTATGLASAVAILAWLAYRAQTETQSGGRLLVVATLAGFVFALGLALVLQRLRAFAEVAERRSEFVSSVTHELKAPVATVRAAGETLQSGRITDPDALREYAQLVVEQAKRLTRLLDNLLAYARITDVADVYDFQPISLDGLVNDTLRDFRAELEAGRFTVEVEVPSTLPPVRADRTAISLLLSNLVDNAIRYSPRTRWLGVTASAGDGVVMLHVADRGTGIPRDEIAKVTRRFYRGRDVSTNGSGLGLAIATCIAVDHGGTLDVQSTIDRGTTVRVTLRVSRQEPGERA